MNETKLVTYPGPAGFAGAQDYTVEVNGIPLFLYNAKVNFLRIPDMDLFPETTPFAYFDMSGEVTVKVTTTRPFGFVDIRPKSYGIRPHIEGNTVSFKLNQPRKLSLEFNGDLHRALHLFANPLESDPPNPQDPNVIYFGPGVHEPGVIHLQSNQTIYLAGGAFVYGIVRGEGVDNTCVRGRGILSAEKAIWPNGGFQVKNCRSLTMRDFILLDSAGWSVKIDGCQDVLLENFKEICYRRNCDGIDLCSTRNAVVRDCFVRNWDDAFCVKGLGNGDSKNIVVTDCVLWSDAAQSIEIGYETQMETIEDVFIKNIDIIHHLMPGYMCITVHNGDRAAISNLRFEDIRIEDTVAPLFDVWVGKAHWNHDECRGRVRDVHFKNIALIGGVDPNMVNRYQTESGVSELSYLAAPTARLSGFDAEHGIDNVTFENVSILGRTLTCAEDGNFSVNEFVDHVQFIPPLDGAPIIQCTVEPVDLINPPVTVTLNASQSTGQGAALVSYQWTFEDGQTASGATVRHTFLYAGNHAVELTVQDALGRCSRLMRIITVLSSYEAVALRQPVPGLNYRLLEGDFNYGTDFDRLAYLAEGVTSGLIPPKNTRHNFHVLRYEGFIKVAREGVYRFFAGMEFGAGYDMQTGGAIYIHNQLITAYNSGWGQLGLSAGYHPVKVIVFQKSGAKPVEFKWMGPGMTPQHLSNDVFYRPAET